MVKKIFCLSAQLAVGTTVMHYHIRLQRIYAPAVETDGIRVLDDRRWPRGKQRDTLVLTAWEKHVSPSIKLRSAWHNGIFNDVEFALHYQQELNAHPDRLLPLMRYARQGCLTLLTASREIQTSHLPILHTALLSALQLEDDTVDDRELSSPTCYLPSLEKYFSSR